MEFHYIRLKSLGNKNANKILIMITAIEPQVNLTGRYTVTQTCKHLGIHRNTLRRYTDEGFIKCSFRKESARKVYLGKEILRFWNSQL